MDGTRVPAPQLACSKVPAIGTPSVNQKPWDSWDKLRFPSRSLRKPVLDRHRILSGLLALLWLTLSATFGGLMPTLIAAGKLIVPVACIWFPHELDSPRSPGYLVRFFGWVALLALTVLRVLVFSAWAP